MTSLDESVGRLKYAIKTLRSSWDEVTELWNDPVRREFERDYWTPIETQTRATEIERARLARIIADARRHVR